MKAIVEEMNGRIFPFLQEVVKHVDEAAAKCEKVVMGGRDVSELYSEIAKCLDVVADDFPHESKSSIDNSDATEDPDGTDKAGDTISTSKKDSLSPEGRSSLRSILSNPLHFSAIIVARFVDESQLLAIIDSRKRANDIYSRFLQYVKVRTKQYPCLNAILQSVREAKVAKDAMRRKLPRNPWDNIIVHRVDAPPVGDERSPSFGKKIVI
jgi:hypothetical protein